MKIRNGFVSNSSSSSFLLYGVCLEAEGEKDIAVHEDFKNWEYTCGPDGYDRMYLGKSWDAIRDDQTGAQFKEEIQNLINKHFGEGKKCSTMSQAWYDG